jgi:hypothetical protein
MNFNISDKVQLKDVIRNTETGVIAKFGTIADIYNIPYSDIYRITVYFNDAGRPFLFESNGQDNKFNTCNLELA